LLEAAPALRGGHVHRVWREGQAWVLLVRHHVHGDPERPAQRRVAFEVALADASARCVAVPPEVVEADDKKKKKIWKRDRHPFLGLLRKHLCGGRVEEVRQVEGDRIVTLRFRADPQEEGPQNLLLSLELIGRSGNLILCHEDDSSATGPLVLGSLHAGRAHRPFERGLPYREPVKREPKVAPKPTLATEVRPDPETLALGTAVAKLQRAVEGATLQESRQGDLLRAIKKAIKRTKNLQVKLARQLDEVSKADRHEADGDLLKANLGQIKGRAASVTLTDYSSGEAQEVELKLDPQKDALENMQARYKKAKKLRRGEVNVLRRQGETDAQLEEFQELRERLEAVDPEDCEALDALENELRRRGALPKAKAAKQREQVNQGPRSFLTTEKHEVLVGRSDNENDRLTMRTARGNDLFFHVAGCPGSHVILRVDVKRPPNHESLVDAAALAVHYSKARQRGKVEVHYTPRKWVRKPKGAKPGLVTISNFKTVRAGGDPERLQRLFETLQREEKQ
jgi:predicted ribosome quality control (RQC) complex YloA/Tae2 family protein